MAKVSLRNIGKRYGPLRVFDGFDLDVSDGELLCLLGPSGSGKSTLLRMIAGLEALDAGEIWVGEREISGLPPRERHLGMMFQGYALYPHLSVRENLAYPLRVRRMPRDETGRRIAEAARLLDIERLLDRRIQQISGGEQQRVAIGRAIVQKPNAYLLDEPISNLDASLREAVRTELRRLQRELRATMIVVTHDQLDALAIADRIAVLRDGVLQQCGTPQQLYGEPANLFVAGFIGRSRMNFLACRHGGGASSVLEGDSFRLRLPADAAALLPTEPCRLVAGFRPEAIEVHLAPRESALAATVDAVHFQGDQVACVARVGAERVQAMAGGEARLAAGGAVWLEPRLDQIHLFNAETGRRLLPRTAAPTERRTAAH